MDDTEMSVRELTYAEAVREALGLCLRRDPRVCVLGLGVPDDKGCFGTTTGLQDEFGAGRVLDVPCAEGSLTGACLGMAHAGLRPVLVHQRMDFSLLSFEQLINQVAKWGWLFGRPVPLVVRTIVGRGWGQGPTHAQCFAPWLASVPGLRVVAPVTPHDAKGMLISAIECEDPVVFLEHRWLHPLKGSVPEGHYMVPLDRARVARGGTDETRVAYSYGVVEAVRYAEAVKREKGVDVEVIDARCLAPLDYQTIGDSVSKTKRLVAVDLGHKSYGFGAEIIARAGEWTTPVGGRRYAVADCPCPSAPALAAKYYQELNTSATPSDVPDKDFRGPF